MDKRDIAALGSVAMSMRVPGQQALDDSNDAHAQSSVDAFAERGRHQK